MATLNTIFARYSYGSLEIKWLQDTVLARDINVHLRMIVPLVISSSQLLEATLSLEVEGTSSRPIILEATNLTPL